MTAQLHNDLKDAAIYGTSTNRRGAIGAGFLLMSTAMFAGANGTPSSSGEADFARNVGRLQRAGAGEDFVEFTLGKTTVIALRDGEVDMPTSRLRKPSSGSAPAVPTFVD